MARTLNLADIQGNVLRPYGLPKARFFCLNIQNSDQGAQAGRTLVEALRHRVTTALPWKPRRSTPATSGDSTLPPKPKVTINMAFTFWGLAALGLPPATLRTMPDEFIEGMKARASLLGDDVCRRDGRDRRESLDHWDPVGKGTGSDQQVHILISIYADMNSDGSPVPELEATTQWLLGLCGQFGGSIRVLKGHAGTDLPYQESAMLLEPDGNGNQQVSFKEHFGFTDGYGDPVFEGQYSPEQEKINLPGGGKILPNQTWAPLATGEFLLGYPDEAQEVPPASYPLEFTHNGTFVAYRKLHQNVAGFRSYLEQEATKYMKVNGINSLADAKEILGAKMVGRWSDGVPLTKAPTLSDWRAFQARDKAARATGDPAAIAAAELEFVDFKYRADPEGAKCPFTSHLRRTNTRDGLDPTGPTTNPPPTEVAKVEAQPGNGSVINNRRRLLRRGMVYGKSDGSNARDDAEHGIIFMAVCASLFRQFEFVQQQWIQYGLDFNVGNDTCPLIGNHGERSKYVIPGDRQTGTRPFVCANLPQFVEVRGGDYFFIPSITALRMIAMGTIDPT